MKNDYAQLLLRNKEIQTFLKEIIVEKSNRYDEVSLGILPEKALNDLLTSTLDPVTIYIILRHYEAKDELISLKRDLHSMCYKLNKSVDKIPQDTNWERAYEYATKAVQISDVIATILGITTLNRNIPCPFHEDNTPSLKIYTKNNHFICFSCNARGSTIDFVIKYKNCSFKEAVFYLSNL